MSDNHDPYFVEHEFFPGDEVFVVLDRHTVRHAKVIQLDIKLYEQEEAIVVETDYLVLLKHSDDFYMETTHRVEVDQIFRTVDEALEEVRKKFIPSVT